MRVQCKPTLQLFLWYQPRRPTTSVSQVFCTNGDKTIPYKGHCENSKLINKALSRKILNNNRFWAGCGRTEHTKGNQTFNLNAGGFVCGKREY